MSCTCGPPLMKRTSLPTGVIVTVGRNVQPSIFTTEPTAVLGTPVPPWQPPPALAAPAMASPARMRNGSVTIETRRRRRIGCLLVVWYPIYTSSRPSVPIWDLAGVHHAEPIALRIREDDVVRVWRS